MIIVLFLRRENKVKVHVKGKKHERGKERPCARRHVWTCMQVCWCKRVQPCFLDGNDTVKCTMRSAQNTLAYKMQGQLFRGEWNDEVGPAQGIRQFWRSGSQLPKALVPNLSYWIGVHRGPVSVHLSLWNGVCLMGLVPARCCSHVSSVIDQMVCGLSPILYSLMMALTFSKVSWRARLLRRTLGLERALNLGEWLFFSNTEQREPGWVRRDGPRSGGTPRIWNPGWSLAGTQRSMRSRKGIVGGEGQGENKHLTFFVRKC